MFPFLSVDRRRPNTTAQVVLYGDYVSSDGVSVRPEQSRSNASERSCPRPQGHR